MRHVYIYHDGEPGSHDPVLGGWHFWDILWDPKKTSVAASEYLAVWLFHLEVSEVMWVSPKIIYFRLGFSTNHPAIGVMENLRNTMACLSVPELFHTSRLRLLEVSLGWTIPKWSTRNEDSLTHGFSMFSIAFATKNCSKKKSRSLRSAWCCRSWSINA